ncbi:MAG: tetraacyldisaccharide 4'-kinase [Acidobacteria bacterium 13_1_40CM_4_69_4]|nr:MAG: tetraacyldisaccharide 4'-kinase [Acidobacteria bacterium 13_1_40CM_4_69_4]
MIGRAILDAPAARPFLVLPGIAYRAAVGLRNALYDSGRLSAQRLPCCVISIGNLTLGGTGKSPLTSWVASMLRESGYRAGVVSRGYRRQGGRSALLLSDGRAILADARSAGDEPYLIARDNPAVPVAVGADRVEAARLLLRAAAPEVIVLDDGFQHRRIARDIDLLLVDGRDPWGNGRMLPRGPLREPIASIARADACILTRSDGQSPARVVEALQRYNPGAALFHCRLEPCRFVRPDGESIGSASLKGFSAYAFSGIARPERFEDDLRSLGIHLAGTRRFSDHHRYRRGDLQEVAREAHLHGSDVLVTTEKDLVRLVETPEGSPPLYALAISVTFPFGPGLQRWLLGRMAPPRPAGGR